LRDLLTCIKTQLQIDDTLSFIRDNDIYITEDETEIPASLMFPAIEIKDGQIKNVQKLGNRYIQSAQVQITIFQRIMQPEQSIMGDYGILAIVESVIALLIGNRLEMEGGDDSGNNQIMNAFPIGETPTQTMLNGETMKIQRKTIFFEYTRNKNW
jgi:hypothetical protein